MKMDFETFLKWEQATRDTIDFKKIYVDMADDLVAGLLLSQIVYWYLPNQKGKTKLRVKKEGTLWLAKGRDDWWDECRIKPRQFDTAVKKLIEKKLIEKKIFKFNGETKVHIRILWDNFLSALFQELDKIEKKNGSNQAETLDTTGINENVNPELQNGESGLSDFVNPLTENTTEKNDDDDKYNAREENSFQQVFKEEAKKKGMPDNEINEICRKIGEQNITFDIEVLQKTLDLVLERYADTEYELTSLVAYFLKAIRKNQERFNFARQQISIAEHQQETTSDMDFPFYNWLEEELPERQN